jgi:mRNA interferase MazF
MKRGEIWLVSLDPIQGREQAGIRPAMVISVEEFNNTGLDLVIICPLTSKYKGFLTHVALKPQESGLDRMSYIKTEDIRSISTSRLIKPLGCAPPSIIADVELRLRRVLGLD